MFKKKRKGFTLVELLVVIAILAILATVSVVGYTKFTKKAKQSNDVSLTTQINTALQADEITGKPATLTEALKIMDEVGANISRLSPTTDNYSYVWNSETNRVILLNEKKDIVAPEGATIKNTLDCFAIIHKAADLNEWKGYSYYLAYDYNDNSGTSVPLTSFAGIDVGINNIETISISDETATGTAIVYTNGGTLTVDAEKATVYHYGEAESVEITAIAPESYHEYGTITGNITIAKGHFVAEAKSSAAALIVTATAAADVKVNLKANSKIATVAATTENLLNDPQMSFTGKENTTVENSTITVNSDFAGGLGTQASPYLISNGEEFKAIDKFFNSAAIKQTVLATINELASSKGKYYFELINDIDLTDSQVLTSIVYNAELNGNAHTISSVRDNYLLSCFINSKLINVTVDLQGEGSSIVCSNYYSSFDTVTVTGQTLVSGNEALFCIYLYYGNLWGFTTDKITFRNCVNKAIAIGTGTYSDYNSVFVGYIIYDKETNTTAEISFENCVNEGSLVCGKASMFVGNMPSGNIALVLNINNCLNKGKIRSTYTAYTPSHFVSTHSASSTSNTMLNSKIYLNGQLQVEQFEAKLSDNFEIANDTTLGISGSIGEKLTITASAISTVAYYVVYVGTYVTWLSVNEDGALVVDEAGNYLKIGTYRFYVTETVQAFEGTKTVNLQWLGFKCDRTSSEKQVSVDVNAIEKTEDGSKYVIKNNDVCMGINEDGSLKDESSAETKGQMVSVSAFDKDGNLISSTSIYKG